MRILGNQFSLGCGTSQKQLSVSLILLILAAQLGLAEPPDIAVIRPDLQTGFSQAGWKYDRYSNLPSLDKGTSMTVADLKGPGIIRHIHICRHNPKEICARGIVLQIYFEGAAEPAVQCPLADFFGDGCNGNAIFFSSALIECAPWSYNTSIRFTKSLKWHINWSQEKMFTGSPEWAAAVAQGGAWIDYATVYYWYQSLPDGYKHQPLPPLAERAKPMIRPPQASSKPASR